MTTRTKIIWIASAALSLVAGPIGLLVWAAAFFGREHLKALAIPGVLATLGRMAKVLGKALLLLGLLGAGFAALVAVVPYFEGTSFGVYFMSFCLLTAVGGFFYNLYMGLQDNPQDSE